MDVGAPCGKFTALAVVNKQSLREKSPVNIKRCKTNKGPDKVLNLSLSLLSVASSLRRLGNLKLIIHIVFGGFVNAGALLWNCMFFSPWQPRLNDCKLPLLHCQLMDEKAVLSNLMTTPQGSAPNKSRVTVFMLM